MTQNELSFFFLNWQINYFWNQLSLFSRLTSNFTRKMTLLSKISIKWYFWIRVTIFQQMKYFAPSDKIMSCNLWSKVTSVFLNINFVQKCQFWGKNLNFVRNVDFFKQLCTTTESEFLIGKHAYFQKILTYCMIVYIHQETVELW